MRPAAGTNNGAEAKGLEVLDAAAAVLARKGYEGTSIDDIADQLGATKGRVYHYYRSKGDILLGVLDAGLERLTAKVQPSAADMTLPPDERLYRMAKAHALVMMVDHDYQVVTMQSVDAHLGKRTGAQGEAWDRILGRRRSYQRLFIDVIEEGHAANLFPDPDTRMTVRAILGAMNWITVWFDPSADSPNRATPNEIAEQFARFVLAGARNGRNP